MRIFITLLLLCGIPCTPSHAQEPEATTSPAVSKSSLDADDPELPGLAWMNNEAAISTERYITKNNADVTVDKYTGTLYVRIPLYELQADGGRLPITLNYSGSGVKLSDTHTPIGLGWNLSAGGRITRVTQGNNDNFPNLKDTYEDMSIWKSDTYYKKFHQFDYDSQPDLYTFDLPGMSGSFVLDPDLVAHTCPYQPVEIQFDTLRNEFTLHDPQGVRYKFGRYSQNRTGISADETGFRFEGFSKTIGHWYLTEIGYPNGGKVEIEISSSVYETESSSFYGTSLVRKTGTSLKLVEGGIRNRVRKIWDQTKYPDKIRYNDQEIVFHYEYDYNSFQNRSNKRLDRLEVVYDGKVQKTICFERDTFPNGNHRLKQVYEQAKAGHKRPIASFVYFEDPVMPGRMHKGFDHWGYWNQDGDDLIGCPFVPIGGIHPDFGTGRASDLVRTRAQSLKSIHYPGGGSKEIVYELHQGKLRDQPMMMIGGGLRVERILERDAPGSKPAEYRYTYEGGVVYAERFNYQLSAYNTPGTIVDYSISSHCQSAINDFYDSPVVYSSVTERLPNGSSVKYDYIPLEKYDDLYPEKYLVLEDTVRYLGFEDDRDLPKTIRAWGRNLLQQETAFDADGKIVKRTSYEYLIDTAAAVRIPGLVPYRSRVEGHNRNCLARYFHLSCPVLPKTRIEYSGKTNLYCRTDYLYNDRHLPTHEIKRYADGTRITAYTKNNYEYYNKINFGTGQPKYKYIPIETIVYRNGKVKSAALTVYRSTPDRFLLASALQLADPYEGVDSASFRISSRTFRGELQYDERYKEAIRFDNYDAAGNMTSYHKADNMPMSIVYHPGRSMPLAYVANARYAPEATQRVNEVWFDDFERDDFCSWVWPDLGPAKSGTRGRITTPLTISVSNFKPGTYILSYWYLTNDSDRWFQHRSRITVTDTMDNYTVLFPAGAIAVDDVSLLPPNATLKSQFSIPGLGTISETDTRGRSLYHEYNGFGLPTRVLDNERQPLKTYSYDHYNPNITIPAL